MSWHSICDHSCARYSTCPKSGAWGSSQISPAIQRVHPKLACYSIQKWMMHLSYMQVVTSPEIGSRSMQNSTEKSRLCWVITYANCLILWGSKMQSKVALSTTKAEYIYLSSALWDVIPLMDLAKEQQDKFNFEIVCSNIDGCHAF